MTKDMILLEFYRYSRNHHYEDLHGMKIVYLLLSNLCPFLLQQAMPTNGFAEG